MHMRMALPKAAESIDAVDFVAIFMHLSNPKSGIHSVVFGFLLFLQT
jgi:hypothetical protein